MTALAFHGYFRSSASWRCRIAFNLKGLAPFPLLSAVGRQCADHPAFGPRGWTGRPMRKLEEGEQGAAQRNKPAGIARSFRGLLGSPGRVRRDTRDIDLNATKAIAPGPNT
jgi:hypothetical protein